MKKGMLKNIYDQLKNEHKIVEVEYQNSLNNLKKEMKIGNFEIQYISSTLDFNSDIGIKFIHVMNKDVGFHYNEKIGVIKIYLTGDFNYGYFNNNKLIEIINDIRQYTTAVVEMIEVIDKYEELKIFVNNVCKRYRNDVELFDKLARILKINIIEIGKIL